MASSSGSSAAALLQEPLAKPRFSPKSRRNQNIIDIMRSGSLKPSDVMVDSLFTDEDPGSADKSLEYIEHHGVRKLGSIEVKDTVLLSALNSESMLTLGADSMDEADWKRMWKQHLMAMPKTTVQGWDKMINADAFVVTVQHATAAGDRGLLSSLVQRYHSGACSLAVFGLPAVQAVINFKWQHFARHVLVCELLLYAFWLLTFTVFAIIWEADNEGVWHSSWEGQVGVYSEAMALLGMIPFVLIDVTSLQSYGRMWFNLKNIMHLTCYVNQVVIALVHWGAIGMSDQSVEFLVALQYILLWLRFQFYFRVFRPTKNTFVESLRSVLADIKWFIVFVLISVWGFAVAFYVLLRRDREQHQEFSSIWHSCVTTVSFMAGEAKYDLFFKSTNKEAASILYMLYVFLVSTLMLHMLVAVMTTSLEKVTHNAGLRFLLNKATTIVDLESTVPTWLLHNVMPSQWYPQYIHVLKVDFSSIDKVELDAVWTRVGLSDSESIMEPMEEIKMRLKRIEALMLDTRRQQTGEAKGDTSHEVQTMPLEIYSQ